MTSSFLINQAEERAKARKTLWFCFFFSPSLFKICILLILKSILNFLCFYLWKQPFCLFVCFFISLSHLLACLE